MLSQPFRFISFPWVVPLKVDDASPRLTMKKVRFTPTETGVHYLNARFGSEPIPGTVMYLSFSSRLIVDYHRDTN